MLKNRTLLVAWIVLCWASINGILGVTLVKFGTSAGSTTFGLDGWNTLLKSSNLTFTSQGNGGLVITSNVDEFTDYRGVRGTLRQFSPGERIAVTWYNNSDEVFYFSARISFTDQNTPSEGSPDGPWYTMRRFDDYRYTYSEIQPHTGATTVFNITDSGVHKTNELFSLVNINLHIEWFSAYQKPFLICEKIELLNDADITVPAAPTGLRASVLSDSKIQLSWDAPTDNVGVVEYLIYRNGEIEGYSRSNSYTCVFLEPRSNYTFTVTAVDACGNESSPSNSVTAKTNTYSANATLINPAQLEYLGAFVLPEDYSWGGEAIAYYPQGDGEQSGAGASDGFPGSLFVTNVNQVENGLVGEVSIPAAIVSASKDTQNLNQAGMLKQPVNIRPANVNNWDFVDIWRTGLEYVPGEDRLYSSWSIHYTVTSDKHASISCCDAANLSASARYGAWFVGSAALPPLDAMMNDWLFSLPQPWADVNCSGRTLVTGRSRDGGLSGLGPTLYAFSPIGAAPPAANRELDFTTLLQYGPVEGTDNYNFPNSIDGYKHSDDWREAVWLSVSDKNAVAIIGRKALGNNWYGYHGERMLHDWVIADEPYPDFAATDPDGKGWRGHNRQPMMIFFDPADLAQVASGTKQSHEPQPYAALRISKDIFFGSQCEIVSAAFDAQNKVIYVTESVRELEARLVVHVWKVNAIPAGVNQDQSRIEQFQLFQNYPNPFNPVTLIHYQLPEQAHVDLTLYNLRGEQVMRLIDTQESAGYHSFELNGENLASGIYFYHLRTERFSVTRKMTVLK